MGYRNDNPSGLAVGDEPESMYAVMGGHHFVLVVGYDDAASGDTLFVNDPGFDRPSYSFADDGAGGDWEKASGLTKKATKQKAQKQQREDEAKQMGFANSQQALKQQMHGQCVFEIQRSALVDIMVH